MNLGPTHLRGKHFLSLADYGANDIQLLIDDAIDMKHKQKNGQSHEVLKGKVLGMIFEKASTRTRVSFEVAMLQLGGHAIFLSKDDIQIGRGESTADTSKVLSRYIDGMMVRTFEHDILQDFADNATIPVINGLTDLCHPAQVMADLMTIFEKKGKLKGLKMCFIGDGNNMANSLIEGAAKVGMNMSVATPLGYEPDAGVVQRAKQDGEVTGSHIEIGHDPVQAVQQADVIVTDVWASMGQEEEQQKRLQAFAAYQVNETLCQHAKADYLFLHCLPAHRGEEVSAEVLDGEHSVALDEAENRLHVQKAILKALMSDS